MKINFGAIGGRRCVTFNVSHDGKVVPAKYRNFDWEESDAFSEVAAMGELISAHEAFKRWKTARQAWRTRRRKQLLLPL